MIKLFKYEAYNITISEEALLLKPFKLIWNRDKSKNKNVALQELGFIYFFTDPRSDYLYITDDEARTKAIKEGEGLPDKWKPDPLIKQAIDFYSSFKPSASLLLEDTRIMVNKFREKMRSISFDDLEVKELKEIGLLIKQIPSLVKDLDEAEKALAREIIQNDRVRGAQEKAIYEDD